MSPYAFLAKHDWFATQMAQFVEAWRLVASFYSLSLFLCLEDESSSLVMNHSLFAQDTPKRHHYRIGRAIIVRTCGH